NAEMRLYADDDQTATLLLSKLPQIEAAASFNRGTALARAWIAAGMAGTLNFHRCQVAPGLLLGTLPPTPPAAGAPRAPEPDAARGAGWPGRGRAAGHAPGAAAPGNRGPVAGAGGPWAAPPAPRDQDAPPDAALDLSGDEQSEGPAEDDGAPFGTAPV